MNVAFSFRGRFQGFKFQSHSFQSHSAGQCNGPCGGELRAVDDQYREWDYRLDCIVDFVSHPVRSIDALSRNCIPRFRQIFRLSLGSRDWPTCSITNFGSRLLAVCSGGSREYGANSCQFSGVVVLPSGHILVCGLKIMILYKYRSRFSESYANSNAIPRSSATQNTKGRSPNATLVGPSRTYAPSPL